ncbi:Synaptotagmin-4 [Durusdinium trenchii]
MRGITIRQLLDFYATLPSMMPHFDPDESTTHDVVRQAIIPMSLQIWSLRSFVVRVHSAKCSKRGTRSSDGLCVVKVLDKELQHKPWRGGGQTVASEQLVWEEEILLEDVAKQEIIQFGLWMGQESLGEVQLKACVCWQGFYGSLTIKDEETFFCVSVRPYDSVHEARAAMSSSMWIPAPCGARSSSILRSSSRPGLLDSGVDAERLEGVLEVRRFSTSSKLTERRRGEDSKPGFAYATCANGGHGRLAQKMVTHAWGNKFSHLLGAVLADALQDATYDGVSRILKQGDTVSLFNKLQSKGKLDVPYWICALCVNQHAGICARPPPTDSTGHAIAPCECTTAKHFDGALSEMNKFDDMMIFLKRTLRQEARENHSDVQLEQVVAIDVDFNLLTRVWCVAELVAARDLHLHQAVQIHSAARRNSCLDKLQILDVREANASFPADKDLVLSKIDDVDDFNLSLQDLMLHRLQSFLHGNEVRAAANICDDVVLGLLTVVL